MSCFVWRPFEIGRSAGKPAVKHEAASHARETKREAETLTEREATRNRGGKADTIGA